MTPGMGNLVTLKRLMARAMEWLLVFNVLVTDKDISSCQAQQDWINHLRGSEV
jgi:hypothetical protein